MCWKLQQTKKHFTELARCNRELEDVVERLTDCHQPRYCRTGEYYFFKNQESAPSLGYPDQSIAPFQDLFPFNDPLQ
jgi:hypothetical protein